MKKRHSKADKEAYKRAQQGKHAARNLNLPTIEQSETPHRVQRPVTVQQPAVARQTNPRHIVLIVVAVALVVVLVAGGIFAWNRWLRYDDAADIQGTWHIANSSSTITITADELRLTDDVEYTYSLNTFDKTLEFSFNSMTGSGSYSFSDDRNQLTITEELTTTNQDGSQQTSETAITLTRTS